MLAIEEKEEDIMEEDWYVTHGVGHRGKKEEDIMEEKKERDWYVTHGC